MPPPIITNILSLVITADRRRMNATITQKTPQFLTSLEVERISDSTWRLLSPLIYDSALRPHVVFVPTGFTTDFASVPRLPIIYAWVGNKGQRAAVIHDCLYRRAKETRSLCDAIFREALSLDNVGFVARWAMWAGVRCFGWQFYGATEIDRPN